MVKKYNSYVQYLHEKTHILCLANEHLNEVQTTDLKKGREQGSRQSLESCKSFIKKELSNTCEMQSHSILPLFYFILIMHVLLV